jgi:predicted RNase H-like nuclease
MDLGWATAPSGLALLKWDGRRLHLRQTARLADRAQILPWLIGQVGQEPCFAGLDAPVLVTNAKGMRVADRLTHQLFSRQHAGAYPVNLGLAVVEGILAFVKLLRDAGFATSFPGGPQAATRHVFEVYPHAASVRLFGLERILPYKKGPLAGRRQALGAFRSLLATGLGDRQPSLAAPDLPPIPESAAALKAVEDELDAVLCAYIAAHFWYWHLAKNNILGDEENGFIVVPSF